ncbi:hypothetical protein [Pseudomonas sp. BMW13]|uniref:hypothetical protein n=1 Tax=Pseudomonadaceae TaxID=135621 RepID=UPI000565BB85|nr:hypothetical protein [Pseudomonas sp. BMW13]
MKRRFTPLKLALYAGILLGFVMLESPLVMLANVADPFILGMPFLFFWNLLWWSLITLLFLVGYWCNWGSRSSSPRAGEV